MNSESRHLLLSSQNEWPRSKEMTRLLARIVVRVTTTSSLCTARSSSAVWSADTFRLNSRLQLRSMWDLRKTTSQISSVSSRSATFNQVSTLVKSPLECSSWPTRRRMRQGVQRKYRRLLKLRYLRARLLIRWSSLVTPLTCSKSKTSETQEQTNERNDTPRSSPLPATTK